MKSVAPGVCVLTLCLCVSVIVCPPVQLPEEKKQEEDVTDQLVYQRYLQQVISILEKDTEFKEKLEKSNSSHIKSREFAMELDFVNHQIREELDEAKRVEIKRLKDLHRKKDGLEAKIKHAAAGHLDHENDQTFEIEDLEKLIKKTTHDLEMLDEKRRDEFKNYEMEKELKRKDGMKGMDEEHKKQAEKQHEENRAKHNDHPKLHHPGSKAQLEEVWEKEDHLDPENFDPRTFFEQRDLNGDGVWTQDEVDTLFEVELNKLYESNHTEDDMKERYEEMARMREHLVKEIDKDDDKMITKEEFMKYSGSKEFEQDEPWEDIADKDNYTDEELAEYEKVKGEHGGYVDHVQPGEIKIPVHGNNIEEMDKDAVQPTH